MIQRITDDETWYEHTIGGYLFGLVNDVIVISML